MIEDKATEKWKKRAEKLGLIVNAGADKPEPRGKAGGGRRLRTKQAAVRYKQEHPCWLKRTDWMGH